MAVVKKEDILQALQTIVGESTDDNVISLLENVTDTFNEYETITADQTDWKQKATEIEESWKKKYRERFFTPEEIEKKVEETKEEPSEDEESEPKTFDDLFETKE